ncbi:MAG: hypothetical protein K2N40_02250, partial [Ureaplasma sp.]|nr:hypothetical protein [Ureaplasma sp.]
LSWWCIFFKRQTNIIKSIHNLEKVVAKPWNQVSVRDIINANVLIMYDDVFELYNSQFVKKFQKNTVA